MRTNVCITNKWYYFIFHYIQNQVLLPVLQLYLSQMELVGNTGLGCWFRMILLICAIVGDTSERVGALYVCSST